MRYAERLAGVRHGFEAWGGTCGEKKLWHYQRINSLYDVGLCVFYVYLVCQLKVNVAHVSCGGTRRGAGVK
jgi:hypothetical protein